MAKSSDGAIWGIHGGKHSEADDLFLKHKVIALGWDEMGDLGALGANREAFKAKIASTYPADKAASIPVNAGQVFRFVHEIKVGDLVVYPSKRDRNVHIGEITGAYRYDPSGQHEFPNRRAVKWLKALPRTAFSQGALYEIGSALSFFQVKNFADEFRAAVEGKSIEPVTGDTTASLVAEEIEQVTRDFVLRKLAQDLKGHPFAEFVAHLLGAMGYRCRVSAEGPDGGVDIIAHKDELGFEPPIIKVQVKSTEGSVGDPVVSALYGKVEKSEYGLLVTLGTITAQARAFSRAKSNLRLIDGEELVDLVLDHYEQFDSKYKGLIPLKRVYVPAPLEEPSE